MPLSGDHRLLCQVATVLLLHVALWTNEELQRRHHTAARRLHKDSVQQIVGEASLVLSLQDCVLLGEGRLHPRLQFVALPLHRWIADGIEDQRRRTAALLHRH